MNNNTEVLKAIMKKQKFLKNSLYPSLKQNSKFSQILNDIADEISDIIHDDPRLKKKLLNEILDK